MYNTVLGAKPILPDGRSFYYSDYNFDGRKVYSNYRWPCCSGTLPQVAADYRICAYFREPQGLFVNLYTPSTVRWNQQGLPASLTQTSSYPLDGQIRFDLTLPRSAEFTLNWRIPAWAEGASLAVNGKMELTDLVPESFVAIHRNWNNGDRIELELPMKLRLEHVDSLHSETVALLRGPLVLFPITRSAPRISHTDLLAASSTASGKWEIALPTGPITFLPFTAIEDEQYSTYLVTSG